MKTFSEFDLLPTLQSALKEKGFDTPTEIQDRAIPLLLEQRSLVGVAQTGSGKTLAYALPVLHHIKSLEIQGNAVRYEGQPRAAILVPTRELGEQVTQVFKMFTHTTRVRVRSILGGTSLDVAKRNASGMFEILIATPGRLIKLHDRGLVSLRDIKVLIFDEADQMLDQGFLPDAERIVGFCPPFRQMAMFTATLSPQVQKLISKLFKDAEIIRGKESHKLVSTLTTENKNVPHGKRLPLLEEVLKSPVKDGTLIFVNTRAQCDKVFEDLKSLGHPCAIYRGEMDKTERRSNLRAFREGKVPFLVSTDLASRGLDLNYVGRVINYHLPQQIENYIHRIGRTARAGRPGLVINFITERDEALMQNVLEMQK